MVAATMHRVNPRVYRGFYVGALVIAFAKRGTPQEMVTEVARSAEIGRELPPMVPQPSTHSAAPRRLIPA